jgi:hypothetical protein
VLGAYEYDGRETALDEIIGFLSRAGRFPVYINVTINGIVESCTIVRLGPSGHAYVDDTEQRGNAAVGLGPFKPLGLMCRILSGSVHGPCHSRTSKKPRYKDTGPRGDVRTNGRRSLL